MNATEFLTEKCNGKTPEELVRNCHKISATYVVDLLEEYARSKEKAINKVTVQNLDVALRMVGITFDHKTIDKIIYLVELIEMKGNGVTIEDICELKEAWKSLDNGQTT